MMRVLTTSICYPTPQSPDQGIFIQRRSMAMQQRGHTSVQVVAPQPWCPLLRRPVANLQQDWPLPAVYPRMFSIPVLSWIADGLAFGRTLERHIVSQGGPAGVDLIDAHFVYPDGVGAWLAGRKLGIPVVVTIRGKIVSLSRRAIRRAQIAAMLRGVDARIAVSRSLAGWVHRVAGSELDVDVIPNGVDPATFYPLERQQARADLGWDPNGRYLLSVGHLQQVKGFDRLIRVMPEIRARLGDVRLVLAGSCRGEWWFRHRVRRLIATCGGSPAVTFTGPVSADRLNQLYNAADLFVNTSRSEGWNNAISESLAAGTPVVAFDVGGNAEQICSPQLGRIVPDGNGTALVSAIIEALALHSVGPSSMDGSAGGRASRPPEAGKMFATANLAGGGPAPREGETHPWNRVLIAAHGGARGWPQVAREVQAVFERVVHARAAATVSPQPLELFGVRLAPAELLASSGRGAICEVSR